MAKASTQTTLYKDPYVEWCYENDKTLINGAKIHTDSLFSRYIKATNLHISGDSSFDGSVAISYKDGESRAVLSVEDSVMSSANLYYDGNVIQSTSGAAIVPCFVVDADHGLVVTGPIKADYLSANSFYGAKGAFTSTITRSLVTETIEAIGSIKSGGKTVSLDGHTHNYAGSSSAGGAANNALKLGGRSLTADGNRWGSVPFVGDDGVMEVGRYIDFHLNDADAGTSGDSTGGRLEADGTNMRYNSKQVCLNSWVKITPTAGEGVVLTSPYCTYNTTLGLATIRISAKITPSADKSSGSSITVATLSGGIVPSSNCPLSVYVAVTNARRWVANIGASGNIVVRANTALTAGTTYEVFICGTFPLV